MNADGLNVRIGRVVMRRTLIRERRHIKNPRSHEVCGMSMKQQLRPLPPLELLEERMEMKLAHRGQPIACKPCDRQEGGLSGVIVLMLLQWVVMYDLRRAVWMVAVILLQTMVSDVSRVWAFHQDQHERDDTRVDEQSLRWCR